MKTSKVGIVAVAVLLGVAGISFGIARAAGTHSEQPVLSFEDQEALEQGSSSSSYVESRPVLAFEDSSSPYAETRPVMSFEDQEATQVATSPAEDMQLASGGQEFVPEGNWSGTDWQARGPVETGAIPVTTFEESWMKGYGND
jgi:hypothetical protein